MTPFARKPTKEGEAEEEEDPEAEGDVEEAEESFEAVFARAEERGAMRKEEVEEDALASTRKEEEEEDARAAEVI